MIIGEASTLKISFDNKIIVIAVKIVVILASYSSNPPKVL
jgi:hypothetical protein